MMNLIEKFFTRSHSQKQILRTQFAEYFFSQAEHQWITADMKTHFDELFSRLPVGVIEAMMTKYPVSFLKSGSDHARLAQTHSFSSAIVVFPEFQKLLATSKRSAVAYLAHELAFVLYELEESKVDPIMAEVEADKFVCDIGLMFELEELLLMLDETIEKRVRLTYLTAHHFSSEAN